MAGGSLPEGMVHFGPLERASVLANIVIFLLLMLYSVFYVSESPGAVQTAPWKYRVRYCIKLNIYITMISLLMNLFAVTTHLDPAAQELFRTYVHVCRPLEWLATCPFMMLQMVIIGGPLVQAKRRLEIMGITSAILILGFFATLQAEATVKAVLFVCGAMGFGLLCMILSTIVTEHTGGETSLWSFEPDADGKQPPLKKLCLKVVSTWIGFPIWWSLSPDGFGFVTDFDLHQGVFLLLNIVSKMVFVIVVFRLDGVPVPQYESRHAPAETKPDRRDHRLPTPTNIFAVQEFHAVQQQHVPQQKSQAKPPSSTASTEDLERGETRSTPKQSRDRSEKRRSDLSEQAVNAFDRKQRQREPAQEAPAPNAADMQLDQWEQQLARRRELVERERELLAMEQEMRPSKVVQEGVGYTSGCGACATRV